MNPNGCYSNAMCTNTDGSYTCASNTDGYEGDGRSCTDIDECAIDTDACNSNALCTNTDGSYTCACNDGYTGSGLSCTECSEGSYGKKCEKICTCVEQSTNPVACNHVDGVCSCTPAFPGAECNKQNLEVEVTKLSPSDTVQGVDLTLQCQINLDPGELQSNTIMWTDPKGNSPNGSWNLGNGTYQLIIPNVNPSDDTGTYKCNATTMLQTQVLHTIVDEIVVDVIAPGEIFENSEVGMAALNKTAVLNCTVYGIPPPNVTWTRLRDSMVLNDGDENGRIDIKVVDLSNSLYQTSILAISDIVREDNGAYVCSALNDNGGDNETLIIKVLESPLIEIATIEAKDHSTITVSWYVTFTGNLPLDVCTVEYQPNETEDPIGDWFMATEEAVGERFSYDITGLMPYTLYFVRLKCSNTIGSSNTVTDGPERTRQTKPSPPLEVNSKDITKTSVLLLWNEPMDKNGPIAHYNIELESDDGTKLSKNTTNNDLQASITELIPGTEYTVSVSAINTENGDDFQSERSVFHVFTTLSDSPTAPVNVQADDGNTICTVRWEPPENPNGEITQYKVYSVSVGRGEDQGAPKEEEPKTITDPNMREFTAVKIDLIPFSKYDYTIAASTSVGEGPKSSPVVSCTTEPGAPQEPPKAPTLPDMDDPTAVTTSTFKMILSPASSRNGQIGCYEVVVIPIAKMEEFDQNGSSDVLYPPDKVLDYEDTNGNPGMAYTALVISGSNLTVEREVVVGDGSSSFCDDNNYSQARKKRAVDSEERDAVNGRLRQKTTYTTFTRAYVPVGDGSKSEFTSSPFMEPVLLPAEPSPPVAGIVVGILIAILVIVTVVLLFIVYRRKQNNMDREPIQSEVNGERYRMGGISNAGMPDVIDVPPISVERMEAEYIQKIANNNAIYQAEFRSIPESTGNVTKEASLNEVNKDKNRYINIIAYDQTRVLLQEIDDEPGSDYINACYVDGYKHPAKFIASQGPRDDTIADFWRMIWEQNTTTIVMLTKCFEHGKDKCAQYWPDNGTMTYENLTVTMEDAVCCSDYVIRKFAVAEKGDEEGVHSRSVTQFHFLGWPDFGIPDYPYSMLAFLKRVRQMTYAKADKGNIVIHCSAGVGRTGTYILIDTMIQMIAQEKQIDVYNYIYKIRSQRNLLVQSIVQYIFIHRALVEEYNFGHTEVDLMNLTAYYLKLTKLDPETQKSGVDTEYKMLVSQQVHDLKQDLGNKEANKEKNRLRQVIPYDHNRVKLERLIGVENSDYVNASFIDGYERKRAYIATQGPLKNTVSDFWRMVWEEQCSTIVVLTKLVEKGQEVCHQYWPNEGDSATESYLAVQHVKEEDVGEYIVRDFQLTNTKGGGLRNIRQYQFQEWPEVGMPESGVSLIKLVGEAQKHQAGINPYPIIVHGSSGAGRTGVFCALGILLSRIQAEGVVDVFQTVRTLRQQRPHMVQDPTQYQFCYKAILNHLDSYGTYANFK